MHIGRIPSNSPSVCALEGCARVQEEHESVSWLVLEGTVLVFDWCEPLTVLGHGGSVAEFLAWGILAMESMINLSTVKVSGLSRV